MTRLYVLVPVYLILLSYIVYEVKGYCARPGYPCYNGKCTEKKTCLCYDPNMVGHDCRVPKDITVNCTNNCTGQGTCYNIDQCYCNVGFYGRNCERQAETIKCGSNSMSVRIRTEGKKAVFMRKRPKCQYQLDLAEFAKENFVYTKEIPVETTAGNLCDDVEKKVQGIKTTYTTYVDVRDNEKQVVPLDYTLKLSCTYENVGEGVVKPSRGTNSMYGVITLNSNLQQVSEVTSSSEFYLAFYPLQNKANTEISVTDLKLLDVDTSFPLYELLHEGCQTLAGEEILASQPFLQQITLPDGTQADATVVHFMSLQLTARVYFDYTVKVCSPKCPDRPCVGKKISPRVKGLRLLFQ